MATKKTAKPKTTATKTGEQHTITYEVKHGAFAMRVDVNVITGRLTLTKLNNNRGGTHDYHFENSTPATLGAFIKCAKTAVGLVENICAKQ